MRSRALPIALLTLAVTAAPSVAQSPFTRTEAADTVPPITSYPLGQADLVAKEMLIAMRLDRAKRDLCDELGCLVIVNESKGYKVTGFHVLERSKDGQYRWGRNQFGSALLARRATFRFKTGISDCERPVKFVLRGPRNREPVETEGRANLCRSPHVDSLVRINVVRPEVIVE